MREEILDAIASHQTRIRELEELKKAVDDNLSNTVKFIIETRHMVGYFEVHTTKNKNKLNISLPTMQLVLDEAIKSEKEQISRLIDMEVDNRMATLRIKE